MALRFLARHGSRLARRGREEGRLARPWSSVSRSKHTVPQEIVAAGLPNSAHDGSILIRRSAFAEFSEACKSPHQMNPAFSTFTLRRCAFKEACQANPPSFNGSCRGFGSFTTDALSHFKGNAAIVLPQKTLFRRISTEAITKKLKLSPSTIKKPIDELMKTASRYKDVAGLQVEGFWKRNVMILVGAAGILACFLLWQIMYGVANLFVSFSEGMAKFGFLGMAAATVAFAAMALRARYTINPDKVYRIAMRMMNTSAAALEVLGPPLTGTDLRAYVMSSGGLKLKKLKPRIGSKRCFLIFPIQGSERKGLVSAEVKKKKGKYEFKLLAIDVAVPGAEQRLFLVGDEMEYKVGGGLIGQLRDPMFKAMAAQEEFDAQDEKEEEEEAKAEEARREQEAKDEEARRNEEIERLEKENANK
ncbi:hypothetical protein GOP47_0001472 [Adiantum capillus-veneris]|uniref:Uncharacterized protein n=1 Tax=Adiantum capillus-veneris TaxID=13818 RepID=A0A9D4ZNA1_ADICA|nr:hypothetical protein GOP47_0001472 [Adiantum capillus-veneris]